MSAAIHPREHPGRVPVTPLERHAVVVLARYGGEESYSGGIESPDSIEWLGWDAINAAHHAPNEDEVVWSLRDSGWWNEADEDDTRARSAATEICAFTEETK